MLIKRLFTKGKKVAAFTLTTAIAMQGSIFATAKDYDRANSEMPYAGEWLTQDGVYTYPVTPENQEWAGMDYVEQVQACNMPQELVNSLSTDELVQVALDYPLMLDCMLFDSYERGVEHLALTSNVYRELLEREDVAETLISAYLNLNVDYDLLAAGGLTRNPFAESDYDKEIMLQSLLSSEVIFNALDEVQTEKLVEILGDKYEDKLGKCDDYKTALIFYEVLSEKAGYIVEDLIPESVLLENSAGTPRYSTGFTMTNSTPQYFGYPGAYYYEGVFSLYDVANPPICYLYSSGNYTAAEADAVDASIASAHPGWICLSTASKKYNCHSYCWINKSYNNVYWLNDPQVFASSSSFSNTGANTSISSSDAYIIIYDAYGPAHSVRSTTKSSGSNTTSYMTTTTVVSKLGSSGVYRTSLYDMYNLYDGKYYISYNKK